MKHLKWLIFFGVGLLSFNALAAAPRMHVALGERWLATFAPQYTEEEKKLFLLGTVFPDIRYLGVINRKQSHFKGVTLKKVYQATSPFQRGMLFHSFVDEQRDKLVRRWKIEKNLSEVQSKLQDTFLKLVEDQILHTQYDWGKFRGYLATIPADEKAYGIELQSLTQWHTGLTIYFSTVPSLILTQASMFEQSILMLDAPTVKMWSLLVPKYAADPTLQTYVKNLIAAFDQILTQQAKL